LRRLVKVSFHARLALERRRGGDSSAEFNFTGSAEGGSGGGRDGSGVRFELRHSWAIAIPD
jgi:hypothetical protein